MLSVKQGHVEFDVANKVQLLCLTVYTSCVQASGNTIIYVIDNSRKSCFK